MALDSPLNQVYQLSQTQMYAESRLVQELCDPQGTEELGKSLEDLTKQEKRDYTSNLFIVKMYKDKQFNAKKQGIIEVKGRIKDTVSI